MRARSALLIAAVVGLLLSALPTQAVVMARLPLPSLQAWVPGQRSQAPAPDNTEAVRAMAQRLQQAQSDARRQQAETQALQQRVAAAEAASRWLPWLVLGLVAAAALAVWLGLRIRRLQREQSQRDWAVAEAELSASRLPDAQAQAATSLLSPDQPLLSGPPTTLTPPSGLDTRPGSTQTQGQTQGRSRPGKPDAVSAPARLPVAPPVPAAAPSVVASRTADYGRTQTLSLTGAAAPPRPVTVEELLDLEQQVDFFMVLGQEQSAIDLLLGHVRATGGISALPYFKLLEIYRRQGDEEAYERTRERFNQRFNATAPDWQGDLAAGRNLIDYPELVARLQRAWQQPLRAVAELEGLLLRRADLEPMDLPAFHDILTLHALVRDLPPSALPEPVTAMVAAVSRPVPMLPMLPILPALSKAARSRPSALDNERTAAYDRSAVDLLLPLDDDPVDITEPQPRMSEPGAARAMLADWVMSRASQRSAESTLGSGLGELAEVAQKSNKLDLDLSDYAPAPREFTRPAAFTDVDMRRDSRMSDLAPFDDSDLLPPSTISRP